MNKVLIEIDRHGFPQSVLTTDSEIEIYLIVSDQLEEYDPEEDFKQEAQLVTVSRLEDRLQEFKDKIPSPDDVDGEEDEEE